MRMLLAIAFALLNVTPVEASFMSGPDLASACKSIAGLGEKSDENTIHSAQTCLDYIKGAADQIAIREPDCLSGKPAIPLGQIVEETIKEVARRPSFGKMPGSWFVERAIFDRNGCSH